MILCASGLEGLRQRARGENRYVEDWVAVGEMADLVAEAEIAREKLAKAREARIEGEAILATHMAATGRRFERAMDWEQSVGEAAMEDEYLRQDRVARGWSVGQIREAEAKAHLMQTPRGRGAESERSLRLLATQMENGFIEMGAKMTQTVGHQRDRTGPSTNSHQNPASLNVLYSNHYRLVPMGEM